jgi:hypothetical protein
MNQETLLDKLVQIEHAIGVESDHTVHIMLMEAEDCLLQMEKEMVDKLVKNANQPPPERPILSEYQSKAKSLKLKSDSKSLTLKSLLREIGIGWR